MFRTSVLVSALALVVVLLAAGAGGVAAQEVSPDSETAETATVAQQQEFVTAEIQVADRSGDTLSDIRVTAEWGDGQSTSDTTKSSGRVLLDVPANAEVQFSVNDSDKEFVRNLQPVEVGPDEIDELITIQMAPRGQVTFSAVNANGNPVEDARIRLTHEDSSRTVDIVYTAGDGTATVPDIEQRTYHVRTVRPGYNATEQTIEVTGQQQSEAIELQSNRVDVDFTVRDDHFEEPRPLEGVTINLRAVRSTAGDRFNDSPLDTDENGETQGRIPANDNYEATVILDGYQETTETFRVRQQPMSLNLTTQLTPSISINQLQNAIVVGQPTQVTITNAYDEPVEDATVSLNDETVGQTDTLGQIVFNITQAGNNVIDASYEDLTASMTLEGVDPDRSSGESDDGNSAEGSTDGTENSANGDGSGPGFGIVAALGAVLAVSLFAARRRS